MSISQISATYERSADNITHAGGIGSVIISVINYYSPSEWMNIGIIVGIFCSVTGLFFSIFFKYRNDRMLKQHIKNQETILMAKRLMGE